VAHDAAPPAAHRALHAHWAARLRRHLAWIVLLKLALIGALFALFFSPGQRTQVDAAAVSDLIRLGR
jgi:hypothetical protein